jgi:hypothetical protein
VWCCSWARQLNVDAALYEPDRSGPFAMVNVHLFSYSRTQLQQVHEELKRLLQYVKFQEEDCHLLFSKAGRELMQKAAGAVRAAGTSGHLHWEAGTQTVRLYGSDSDKAALKGKLEVCRQKHAKLGFCTSCRQLCSSQYWLKQCSARGPSITT